MRRSGRGWAGFIDRLLEISRHCCCLPRTGRVVLTQELGARCLEILRGMMARAAGIGKNLLRRFSSIQVRLAQRRAKSNEHRGHETREKQHHSINSAQGKLPRTVLLASRVGASPVRQMPLPRRSMRHDESTGTNRARKWSSPDPTVRLTLVQGFAGSPTDRWTRV